MTDEPTPARRPGDGGNDSPSQDPNRLPRVGRMTNLTLNNHVEMPALGLGVFQTPPDETRAAVAAALESRSRRVTGSGFGDVAAEALESDAGRVRAAALVGRPATGTSTPPRRTARKHTRP